MWDRHWARKDITREINHQPRLLPKVGFVLFVGNSIRWVIEAAAMFAPSVVGLRE